MELDDTIIFDATMQSITRNTGHLRVGKTLTISGYGNVAYDAPIEWFPRLREANLTVVARTECRKVDEVSDKAFCAIDLDKQSTGT